METEQTRWGKFSLHAAKGGGCRAQDWKGPQVISEPPCNVRKPLRRPPGKDGDFVIRNNCFSATI